MSTSRASAPSNLTANAGASAAVAALAVAHVGVDAVAGSVTALLPILDDRFELSGTVVGSLIATISASSLLAQPLAGRFADRVGPKKVAVGGAVVSSVLLALLGVVGHLGLVFALMVVGGLGSAGFHPAAAVVARRVLPGRASLAVGLFSAGGMVGLAFGPLAILLVAAHAGVGFTPLLMIPGVALAGVLWRVLPEDPPAGPVVEPTAVLRLLHGPVGALAGAGTLAAVAVTTFNVGIPLWLTRRAGVADDAALIGWTLAAFELAAAAGGLAAGWTASRVAPSRLAGVSLAIAPAPLAVVLAAEAGSIGFFAAVVAAGALSSAAMPLLIVAAQDRAPDAVAAASGMLMGFANGVAGIAFVAVGVLADAAGLQVALLAGFAAVVPAALLAARSLAARPAAQPVLSLVSGGGCGCSSCELPTAA